jgi:tRNA-binding protein
MKQEITYEDYNKIEIRVGTVLSVSKNEKAKKPSLILEVDFGKEVGTKKSSAQITHYYNEQNLVGKQVVGVCNFPIKNIAGMNSEFLVLGAIERDGKVVLLHPSQKIVNGLEVA